MILASDPALKWFAPALDRMEAMARSFIAELPKILLGLSALWTTRGRPMEDGTGFPLQT